MMRSAEKSEPFRSNLRRGTSSTARHGNPLGFQESEAKEHKKIGLDSKTDLEKIQAYSLQKRRPIPLAISIIITSGHLETLLFALIFMVICRLAVVTFFLVPFVKKYNEFYQIYGLLQRSECKIILTKTSSSLC